MVCFVNLYGMDRIIYFIFQRFDLESKNRTLKLFTQQFDIPNSDGSLLKQLVLGYDTPTSSGGCRQRSALGSGEKAVV